MKRKNSNDYILKHQSKFPKSFEIFPDILSNIQKDGVFTSSDIEKLESLFGDRVKKALELISGNRVKKYLFEPSGTIRWVVQGEERNYLVIEQLFCSCKDFLFNVLLRREVSSCYHLLAREIAEKTEKFEVIPSEDNDYTQLMEEWLT